MRRMDQLLHDFLVTGFERGEQPPSELDVGVLVSCDDSPCLPLARLRGRPWTATLG